MKEKRNSRICLFALLVLVFTLGFGFSVDTSKQSLAVSSQVVQADENNGILAFIMVKSSLSWRRRTN